MIIYSKELKINPGYIEREAAITAAFDAVELYRSDYEEIAQAINDVPSADAAPVRHGYNATKRHPSDEFVCSECGIILRDHVRYDPEDDDEDIVHEYNPRFCPECGAKMDKEA